MVIYMVAIMSNREMFAASQAIEGGRRSNEVMYMFDSRMFVVGRKVVVQDDHVHA